MNRFRRNAALRLLASLTLCFAVAALGSIATRANIPGWYEGLAKPAFTPPNYVFPIVWNLLYGLLAFSLWRLWQSPDSPVRTRAITGFLMQLSVNLAWSWIFFGAKSIGGGLFTILALDVLVAMTIWAAWKVDRIAAVLLVPYLLWIGYATALNAEILRLNG